MLGERIALIYCRVSSERQKAEGHGLESQEHRCREYAKQNGYSVGSVFRDTFSGGGDFMKRPAMRQLLEYVDQHVHKNFVVIFDDLSRFARDVPFHIKLRQAFNFRDIKPLCLNFNFDDSPEGELVETIMAAQNQYHRKNNRRNVIQKTKARLEKGLWPFYPPPGYEIVKDPIYGKLLKPNKKSAIIREALEGFASGRFPNQVDVQRFLQDNDFCAGAKVHLEKVKRLLTRVIYAGYVEYPDWNVSRREGHHEAIISLETYQRIEDKLAGRIGIRTMNLNHPDFPLRRLVKCICGKYLTASWTRGNGGQYPNYRCNNRNCEFYNKMIRREVLDEDFKNLLLAIKPSGRVLKAASALFRSKWDERIFNIKNVDQQNRRRLEEINSQIQGLIKRISRIDGDDQLIGAYEDEMRFLGNEKLGIEDQLNNHSRLLSQESFETALNLVLDILKNPYLAWSKGDVTRKKLVYNIIFEEHLTYNKKSGFETAILCLPLRVFELLEAHNSHDVEMAGLNPRVKGTHTRFYQT